MAEIIVPVIKIGAIRPHGNADSLEIAEVGGWQVVTGKGNVKEGDTVVHFPPQAILPVELSDALGVTKYLSKQRVKAVRLCGEVSHGFIAPYGEISGRLDLGRVVDGEDVARQLGVTKYEPPVKVRSEDAAPEVDEFPKYTSIENMRNHRGVFSKGESVVVTEKVHGTNSRIGMVRGEMFAGSKGVRRKPPQTPDGQPLVGFEGYRHHTYWFPWSLTSVQELMAGLYAYEDVESVILYGEIYGPRIQKLGYGMENREIGYVAFDLCVNGKYLDYGRFADLCDECGVPRVPEITKMEFDYDMAAAMADGGSLLGGNHIREGVVVKPLTEGHDPKIGRRILKFVSSDYLAGDWDGTDDQA